MLCAVPIRTGGVPPSPAAAVAHRAGMLHVGGSICPQPSRVNGAGPECVWVQLISTRSASRPAAAAAWAMAPLSSQLSPTRSRLSSSTRSPASSSRARRTREQIVMDLGGAPLEIDAVPGELDAERWRMAILQTSTSHECGIPGLRPGALSLDPAQHQAVDDLATADDEDDEHRQTGDDSHRQHLRVVRGIERAELREAKGNRFHLVALDDDQRPEQVIPALQEREDPECGERWPRQRQDHREEDAHSPAPSILAASRASPGSPG